MKKLAILLVSLPLILLTGCPGAWAVVTQVIAAVADAIPIIEEIAQWADRHFSAQPDPTAQAALDSKLNAYRSCLTAVDRAAQTYGAGPELDVAKANCSMAWTDLSQMLASLKGVKQLPRAAGAEPGLALVDEKTGAVLTVLEPLAGAWQ